MIDADVRACEECGAVDYARLVCCHGCDRLVCIDNCIAATNEEHGVSWCQECVEDCYEDRLED